VNITIRDVVKRFGAVTAVDRADLTVDDGVVHRDVVAPEPP